MKKILLTLFSVAAFAVCTHAQIKLTAKTHGFNTGDSHPFTMMKSVTEGESGENVIWDFSNLETNGKNLTSHMLDPKGLEGSSVVASANLVLEEFGNQFYFKTTNETMEQYGTVSCNTVTRYDKPFLKLKFPFTYGNKVAGSYSGVQLANNVETPVSGTYEIFGDAYGTLLLPGNVALDNVLRVRQTRTIENKGGNAVKEVTYRWYTANIRYPVLVMIKYESVQHSQIVETAMYSNVGNKLKSATSITDVDYISDISLYPNPYQEKLKIEYTLEKSGRVSIDLFDASGKLYSTLLSNARRDKGLQELTVAGSDAGMKPGIYYVRISMNNSTYTRKVVKM